MGQKKFYILMIVLLVIIFHTGVVSAGSLSPEKRAQIIERLEELQAKYERGEITWKPGITEYTFMSDEELEFHLGIHSKKRQSLLEEYAEEKVGLRPEYIPRAESLPSRFDWRNNNGNWVTPVKDQYRGSCWAYASIALLETAAMIANEEPDKDIDLSEAFLCSCGSSDPDYSYEYDADDKYLKYGSGIREKCDGAAFYKQEFVWGLRYLVEKGTVSESCLTSTFPNTCGPRARGCRRRCEDWKDQIVRASDYKVIANYATLPQGEAYGELINAIKRAIVDHGLVFTFIYLDKNFVTLYKGGVHSGINCKNDLLSLNEWDDLHAVAIIGWEDDTQSWVCKNSWGGRWGETIDFKPFDMKEGNGGYFRMRWDSCLISLNPAHLIYEDTGGEVTSIAVSAKQRDTQAVSQKNVLYVTISREGASDRLYRSPDEGESWEILRGFYGEDELLHGENDYWNDIKNYYDDGPITNVIALKNDKLMLLNNSKPMLFKWSDVERNEKKWQWSDVGEDKMFYKISPDPNLTEGRVYGINSDALWMSIDYGTSWQAISDRGGSDFAVNRYGPIYFVDGYYGNIYYLSSASAYYPQLIKSHFSGAYSVAVCPSDNLRSIVGIGERWAFTGYGNPPDYFGLQYGNLWANTSGNIEGMQHSTIWPSHGCAVGLGIVSNPYDADEVSYLPLVSLDSGDSWYYPFSFPKNAIVNPYALGSEMHASICTVYVGGSVDIGGYNTPAVFKGLLNWESLFVE